MQWKPLTHIQIEKCFNKDIFLMEESLAKNLQFLLIQ